MRSKSADSLVRLGQLTGAVLEEMLLPRLQPDGLLQGVEGRLEGPSAIDAGEYCSPSGSCLWHILRCR